MAPGTPVHYGIRDGSGARGVFQLAAPSLFFNSPFPLHTSLHAIRCMQPCARAGRRGIQLWAGLSMRACHASIFFLHHNDASLCSANAHPAHHSQRPRFRMGRDAHAGRQHWRMASSRGELVQIPLTSSRGSPRPYLRPSPSTSSTSTPILKSQILPSCGATGIRGFNKKTWSSES